MGKIISFKGVKKRNKNKNTLNEYALIATINVTLIKMKDGVLKYEYSTITPNIKEKQIYKYLLNILEVLSKDIPKINIDYNETYATYFTVFYYENIQDKDDFKFVCSPNFDKKKLIEYIYLFLVVFSEYNTESH